MHIKQILKTSVLPALLMCTMVEAQSITLEQLQQLAADNYPLLKRKALARNAANSTNDNLGKNYLPQINLLAQATWQSDVTAVPQKVPIPAFAIEPLSKDQYRAVLDVNQLIYDGGQTKQQKALNDLQVLLKEEEVNVGLQQLKERINSLYLGVLLLDEQRRQNALVVSDLDAGIAKVDAQVKNGTAFRSNLALLQSEKLKAQQRDMELQNDREGLMSVLSLYAGKDLPEDAKLTKPAAPILFSETDIDRPEMHFYKLQDSLTKQQALLIDGRLKPRISLFANGGYGRPGLNMLKNEFAPFVTTGVRLNWNISGFYTNKNEKDLSEITRKDIATQQENFLLNTRSQLRQQQSNINKLKQLLATDEAIIDLKTQVKEASKSQLENGVITASDYLREVNAEDQVRQTRILHDLQLLQAMLNYSTTAGK
jgi:outer membrane protein TolC